MITEIKSVRETERFFLVKTGIIFFIRMFPNWFIFKNNLEKDKETTDICTNKMAQNRIHIASKPLFSQCDYRWINELSIRNRTLCDYFDHFLR